MRVLFALVILVLVIPSESKVLVQEDWISAIITMGFDTIEINIVGFSKLGKNIITSHGIYERLAGSKLGGFLQSCNKSVSWYLGYRTFLQENPDIFK